MCKSIALAGAHLSLLPKFLRSLDKIPAKNWYSGKRYMPGFTLFLSGN